MDEVIKSAIETHLELSLKLNKGEHHRIMKTGWTGSLWIFKTETLGYRVETTGSVGTRLNPEIKNFLKRDFDRETVKGYKIWYVDTAGEVRKIIDIYGRI
jgi:hypothetical protein